LRHTIGIEPDEDASLTVAGSVKIVIRRKNGDESGTPLRGIDENTARAMLPAVKSAFLCGVRASRWIVAKAVDHIELSDSPDVAAGIVKIHPKAKP
jgi:hypothetical protein